MLKHKLKCALEIFFFSFPFLSLLTHVCCLYKSEDLRIKGGAVLNSFHHLFKVTIGQQKILTLIHWYWKDKLIAFRGNVQFKESKRLSENCRFTGSLYVTHGRPPGHHFLSVDNTLPSPCTASSQAFSVNAFRGRFRDENSLGSRDPKRSGQAQ